MKIDRVIFCFDGHPDYAGMYELQRRLWAKLGIQATLMIVGDSVPDMPGSIRLETDNDLPQDPPGGRNWKSTMALLHGPRLFPGETIMASGIDQFPLSRAFINHLDKVPDDAFVVAFGGIGGSYDKLFDGVRYYPSSHVVARHDLWEQVMAPAPRDFPEFLRWAWVQGYEVMWPDHAVGWGMDEAVLGHLLTKSGVKPHVFSKRWFDDWNARRRGRGCRSVRAKLHIGEDTELHAHRPLPPDERDVIEHLIETL